GKIHFTGLRGERPPIRRMAPPEPNGSDPIRSAPRGPLPDFIPPQLAQLVDRAPVGDRWLHEIKFDGYRTEARIAAGKVRMLARKGLDWTAKFDPVASTLAGLSVRAAYLDGEIAALRIGPAGIRSG